MAKSRGRKFAELVAPTNGVFAAASIPTIALSKLASSTFSVNSESASLGGNVELDSNDITEHSSALYFTNTRADSRADVRIAAHNLLARAGGTMTGNLTLGDNVNAYFGASTDLRIYHDGTNSHIINSTGELRFTGSNFAIKSDSAKLYFGAGDDLQIYHDGLNSYIRDTGTGALRVAGSEVSLLNAAHSEFMIKALENGAVTLYYDSVAKLATVSSGVSVTGEIRPTSHLVMNHADNQYIYLGAGNDLQIYHDGSHSYIDEAGTGNLYIRNGTKNSIFARSDGEIILYHNGSAKLATTSTGVQTTGTLNVNGAFSFPTSDGSANQILQTNGSGTLSWVTNSGGSSVWSSSGSDIYYTSGEVGIGTNSPNQIFHIKNTGQHTTMRIENDNADFLIQAGDAGDDGLHFYDLTNTAYRMTIDNSGQVGIGTTTPGSALQINSSDNQKIIFSGSNDPYIRWQEGTTNKGYMQWNAAGYFELRNEEVSSYWTLGNAFAVYPTTDEAFVIQRSGSALRQKIYNTSTTGTYSYLQLTTVNSSSTQNSGYLIKNAAQNTGNSLGNNSLYLWNESDIVELVPAGTIAKRLTVNTDGDLIVRGGGAAVSYGVVGEGYNGYFGLRQASQTKNSEYMILSANDHTYISASSGYDVIIRNGGNDSTNQLIVGSGATDLKWRGSTVWTAENDGAGSGLDADTLDALSSEDFARIGSSYGSVFGGTPSSSNIVRFDNASGQSMNSTSGYLSRLECRQATAGADAFMTFHVASDYAFYFGIDGATNDLSVGGWSMGANKYKVWHAGNDGASSGLFSQYTNTLVGTGGINNAVSSNHVEYSGQISSGTTGLFNASNNANGILRLNTHPGNYYHDLGFSSDGNMYHRNFTNSNAFTTAAWYKVWDESNDGPGSGLDADTLDGLQGTSYMGYLGMATNRDDYVNLRVVRNTGSSAGSNGMYIGYGNAGSGATRLYGGGQTSNHMAVNAGNITFSGLNLSITNTSIRSAGTSNWDGNPGAEGKIQYHSNRWYIVGDQSSNRIVQFRRNGTDVSYIDNGGNFVGNVTGTLGGISTANLVGAHNNSHSASLEAEVGALHFYRNGANSGISNHPYALYQASGGWSTPYPDLNIAYHTGISLGGNNGYDGIRFFNDYTMATRILQVNGASNYIFKDVWMHTDSGEGMYSSGNGAHIYPNSGQSAYAPWTIVGNRGGYGGFFDDYGDVHWMHDSSGNGGEYMQAFGWYTYFHRGNGCLGIGTSTTSSSYVVYAAGGIYATGNVVAYSDRRIKENIAPIDNALEKVNKLEGVYYNRIDDEKKTREIGFIAQDVNEVSPELVTYAEDVDQYGVKYGNTTALLVEAVKELTRQVNDLKKKLEEK